MRRIDRRRLERFQQRFALAGAGFALGALVATGLIARFERVHGTPALASTAAAATAVPRVPPPAASPDAVATAGNVPPANTLPEAVVTLQHRKLQIPVVGVRQDQLRDTFTDSRALGRPHEAIDIMAAHGTEVRAVEDGVIAKLFTSKAGGITVYQFDPTGTFSYYYAHLDRYASGLAEQQTVRRGQLIGYVGSTGNASTDAPHLHFAITQLGPEKRWWQGTAINPYPLLSK